MITEIECVFVAVPVPGARLAHAVGMEKTAQSAVFRILPVIGAMLRGKESVSAAGSDVNVPDTVNQRKGVTNVMQRDAEYVGLVGLDQSAKNIAPPGREEVLGTSHVTRMGTRCAARDGMGPSVSCTVCHKTITSMDIILVTPVGKKVCFSGWHGPKCLRHCVPQNDDVTGHYICDASGYKVCVGGHQSPHCLPLSKNNKTQDKTK